MKYLEKSFSVALGSDAYRDGWDAVFGKKVACENCLGVGGRSSPITELPSPGTIAVDGPIYLQPRYKAVECPECAGTGKVVAR